MSPKLEPSWVRPFEVIKCYPNRIYRLDGHKIVINESRMKLYHPVDKQQVDNSQDEIVSPKRRKTIIFNNSNRHGDSNEDVNSSPGRSR